MFKSKSFLGKFAITIFLLMSAATAFAQDDDAVSGKVLDAGNRTIGKADLILDTGDVKTNFGYKLKLWLDGGSRLIYIRPASGSRSSGIKASFTEYRVDAKNPDDSGSWNETGSGTATLQMSPSGDVKRITASVTQTTKVVGDNEVAVSEKPQKFVIVLD